MEKDYLQAEIQDESLMDFMKNHTPDGKNSKLEPFKQQIFFLKEQGYSSTQIALFLEEKKGVKITRQAVEKFIKTRHSQQNTFPVFKKRMVDKDAHPTQNNKTKNRLPERIKSKPKSDVDAVFKIDDTPLEDLI